MKILSVSVSNFLTFGDKESKLSKVGDRTILVGPNGAGKTNLFRAIETAVLALGRPRPDLSAYVREGEPGRLLRIELDIAFTENEATLIGAVLAFCASTNLGNIQNLKVSPNDLPELVRNVISKPPVLFRDVLRQRVRLIVTARGGDPTSTRCELRFGPDSSGLVLVDYGLFWITNPPLTSWSSQSLTERVAATLEKDNPGTIFNPPGPTATPPPPGPAGFGWLREVLKPGPDGRPVSLQLQGISLVQQVQGLRPDDEDFLRMRNELWFRGWSLGDIGPMGAFGCVMGSAIAHLSGAREQPGEQPIRRAPMVNPQVPRVTGRDLAIGLFELKNNPSLIGRLRFEQLQTEFHDLTGHTVDVVIVGEAPKPQEEQPYPPALYPRLAMGTGNFEFPVEAEAAGNLEVLLVLYATVGVTDSVVLLDEPAINLHPSKQQRLYTFIRDCSKTNHNQVFIVTHSTTFVTPDDLVTAVRVEPGSSGSRLRQIRYATAAARAKAKGTGLFNHEVLSALFAERALIYEGHDEAAALPVWFERCPRGELVVSANVVHINARGMTSIPAIARMLRTWGIPYRAIADRKARDVLKSLGARAITFRWADMTGLVNSALPGKLSQQQKKLGTRQKSPINFFAIAHKVPPPAPVLALWKRLLPFIEGKEN